MIDWLSQNTDTFWEQLQDFSFKWLDALGWEKIDRPFLKLRKKSIANFTEAELKSGIHAKAYQSGELQFTGYGLCGYTTLIASEAIRKKYPQAKLSWIKILCDTYRG